MYAYIRKEKLEIQGVLSKVKELMEMTKITKDKDERKKLSGRHEYMGNELKFLSVRLKTFATKGIFCVDCNLEGKFFAVERHAENDNFHLNFYAVDKDGNEVLMTHDHILARSLGGADNISNTQTMCTYCNAKKSVWENELRKSKKKAA